MGWPRLVPVGNVAMKTYLDKDPTTSTDNNRIFFPFYLWFHSLFYNVRALMYFLRKEISYREVCKEIVLMGQYVLTFHITFRMTLFIYRKFQNL